MKNLIPGLCKKWIPPSKNFLQVGIQAMEAPASTREECGVDLGGNYPEPCVDHSEGRARALAALATLKTP